MLRRSAALLFALILCLSCFSALAVTPENWSSSQPQNLVAEHLYGKSVVLIDMDTGTLLFNKDGKVRMHPASTTKIMTLLLGLESNIGLDTVITIPQEAAQVPKDSSLVPVTPGEQMTFRDLLYGMMLSSGNDGCNAIAVLVSGSVDAFVETMNRRAAELGMEGTNYTNPHGYTADDHYTTAMDLAKLTCHAMQNQIFRDIVACPSYIMTTSARGQVTVLNKAEMVVPTSKYYYADCIGVKTGFTNAAGNCFVGAVKLQNKTAVSVVLGTSPKVETQKWLDTEKLFEFARTCYDKYNIEQLYSMLSGQLTGVTIQNAHEDDIGAGLLELDLAQVSNTEYSLSVLSNNSADMSATLNQFVGRTMINITDDLVAPVTQGEIIGNFAYQTETGDRITAYLVASRSVEVQPEKFSLTRLLPFLSVLEDPSVRMWLLIICIVLLLIVILRMRRRIRRNRRRRRIYNSRKRVQNERARSNRYDRYRR